MFLSARELATPLIQPPKGDFFKKVVLRSWSRKRHWVGVALWDC